MKKILGLIVIILIAFIGWKGWDYYQSTYVGLLCGSQSSNACRN